MNRFNILVVLFALVFACKGQDSDKKTDSKTDIAMEYSSFGDKIDAENAINGTEMTEIFQNMAVGDTIGTKFIATVKQVCQAKGCWMKLKLKDGQETMVRFKDYGFFMPKEIAGKEVVVNGLAFVEEMSVEDQRHYAKDSGATGLEIGKITEPKKIFGFEADGVLLKQ